MREVFVAGIGMTPFGRFPDTTIEALGRQAILAALEDAGIGQNDVEVAYAGHARTGRLHKRENGVGQLCCWSAGIREIPIAGVGNFCASGSTALRETWMAVGSGLYDVGLAIGVEQLSKRPEGGQPLTSDGMELEGELGFTPPAFFALAARRYMHTTGVDPAVLAQVAVKNRRHASLNPYAQYRSPITLGEVLGSPMVADPLTRLSCCPTSDGAAAAILVSREAAERLELDRLVRVLSSSLASGGYRGDDIAHLDLDHRAALAAYEMADVGPEDVDVAEVHDAFTICEIIHYEDLGFCPMWEGAAMVQSGDSSLGGRLPVSTSGGLLSRGHPLGATGIAQAHEVVTQLRGEAGERQVEGARIGLTHCVGGFVTSDAAASAVHILAAA
ncbi:MAG: thiolase family protein [Solirubrobacterales bacterium]|nr:thiolase family protein [Solirubrobacterales bacterium]